MVNKKRTYILRAALLIAAVLFWIMAAAVPAYAAGIPVSFDGDTDNVPAGGLYIAKEGKAKFSFTVDEANGLKVYRNRVFADISDFGPGEEREYTEPYSIRAQNFARDLKGGYLDMIIRCKKLKIVSGSIKKAVTPSTSAVEENDRCLTLMAMSDGHAVAQSFSIFSDPERYCFGAEQILELSFVYHDTGELYTESINYSFTDLDQGDYLEYKRQFFTNKRGYMETISLDGGFKKVHVAVPESEWLLRILGDAVFIPTATDSNTLRSGFIAEGSGAVTVTWTGSECGTEMVDLFENKGGIRIGKASAYPALTEGNTNYSLKGAVYGVYRDEACSEELLTLETDDEGTAYTGFALDPGTYYVKEKTAPSGFALSDEVFEAAVENGVMTEIAASETPLYTTAETLLTKVDSLAGERPQGDAALSGAEYTLRFFASEDTSGQQLFEAVFTTDDEGALAFSGAEPVTGSFLYKDPDGHNILPLGVLEITETAAPAGYGINTEKVLYRVYEEDGRAVMKLISGGSGDGDETEPVLKNDSAGNFFHKEDIGVYGAISVKKLEGQRGAGLPGASFSIINDSAGPVSLGGTLYSKGEEIIVLTTDDSGAAATDTILPYGTYTVVEKEAPDPYGIDEAYSDTIVIRDDALVYPAKECVNYKVPFEHGITVTSYKDSVPSRGSAVGAGDIIKYTVETVNTGAGTAENIRVRDYIPYGTEYIDGSVTGNGVYVPAEASGNGCAYVEWTYDSLGTLESASTEFSVTVIGDPPVYIENLAYTAVDSKALKPGDPENPEPGDETDAVWHVTDKDREAPCTVKAVLSSEPVPGTCVSAGDRIDYFITVTNESGVAARNTGVYDPIPEGTSYIDGSASAGGVFGGDGMGWLIDELEPGDTVVLRFSVKVTEDVSNGEIVRDQAYWGASDSVPERSDLGNSTNITEHPVSVEEPESVTETGPEGPDETETDTEEESRPEETLETEETETKATATPPGGDAGDGDTPAARSSGKRNVKTGDPFRPGLLLMLCLLCGTAAVTAAVIKMRFRRS